jgi:hypothetical protein
LLGAADSGKSTFLKQLKILQGDGFSEIELEFYKKEVVYNFIQQTGFVIDAMGQQAKIVTTA